MLQYPTVPARLDWIGLDVMIQERTKHVSLSFMNCTSSSADPSSTNMAKCVRLHFLLLRREVFWFCGKWWWLWCVLFYVCDVIEGSVSCFVQLRSNSHSIFVLLFFEVAIRSPSHLDRLTTKIEAIIQCLLNPWVVLLLMAGVKADCFSVLCHDSRNKNPHKLTHHKKTQ